MMGDNYMQNLRASLRHIWPLTLLLLLLAAPWPAAAQRARSWYADPALLTGARTIGPNGGILVPDTITDIALEDGANGWATAGSGIYRLENSAWRHFSGGSGTTFLRAISLAGPDVQYIVGSETERVPPYASNVLILRYLNGDWRNGSFISHEDTSTGLHPGSLNDVVAREDATADAVGEQPSDVTDWPRPLVLHNDGVNWHDTTPAAWRYGRLISLAMVSPSEGWAAGQLGRPGGEGPDALRAAIVHLKDGVWTEQTLPDVPTSVNQVFSASNLQVLNPDEAWAIETVTSYATTIPSCPFGYLLHYKAGAWSLVDPAQLGSRSITALGLFPGSNRGWASLGGCQAPGQNAVPQRAHFDNGAIIIDSSGTQLAPSVYALLDSTRQWAAAGGSFMTYSDAPLPTDRINATPPGDLFFPETGHSVSGEFKSYYQSHGLELGDRGITARESLALFGYPVSEPYDEINAEDGQRYRVQYFERARFELHPENQPPYRVLLGRLGFTSLISRRSGVEPVLPNPNPYPPAPECARFAETGYSNCPPFAAYWQRHGGLPVFGFPIVNMRQEQNATDGNSYNTQWFERERMEHHPENAGTPYDVLLGLLGSEELRVRGYLP
jgi:hypothetical protein